MNSNCEVNCNKDKTDKKFSCIIKCKDTEYESPYYNHVIKNKKDKHHFNYIFIILIIFVISLIFLAIKKE